MVERTKEITCRSNGDKVIAVIGRVDRVLGEAVKVVIKVPEYNAAFTFTRGVNKRGIDFAVIKEPDGRQPINDKKAILHVRNTVYYEMAKWAWSIMIDPRKVPEAQERRW